jgi:hypothetical protein
MGIQWMGIQWMGIQWMVRWSVLVHFRPSVVVLSVDQLG